MADRDEYVTINGVDLALDGAWVVVDPTPLLGQAPMRGQDRVIPGSAGRKARARVRDAWDVLLELFVFGEKDQNGAAHASKRAGLRDNLSYLRSNLLTGGSETISVTFADATSVSGTCVVNELLVAGAHDGLKGNVARVVLDLTILEGRLS